MRSSLPKWLIGAVVLVVVVALVWKFRPKHHAESEAYVAEPTVNVWSTTAQVRQVAAEIHWGDRVEVVGHLDTFTKVRTNIGVAGWVESRRLVDGATWQKGEELVVKA